MEPFRVEILPNVQSTRVEGDYVLMDLKQGIYLGLDPVASQIWQSFLEHGEVERAIEELCSKFEVEPAQARVDIELWIEELGRKGLVRVNRAPREE